MKQLQDDHHRTMESLQRQLETTENQLYRLQQEHMSWAGQARAADSKESPLESASGGGAGAMGSLVPSLEEREQGEVSLYW